MSYVVPAQLFNRVLLSLSMLETFAKQANNPKTAQAVAALGGQLRDLRSDHAVTRMRANDLEGTLELIRGVLDRPTADERKLATISRLVNSSLTNDDH